MGGRKYFLDWLRVGAFGLLIVFHTGMLYVSWPYNLKSPRLVTAIEPWMDALSPWRMALVFFISGAASQFLLAKLGPGGFALDRLRRLQPPILTGMVLIIPAQTYVELVVKRGLTTPYLQFWWGSYLRADQTLVAPLGKTMPTWDHLWFLVYLFAYAVALAAAAGAARRLKLGDRRAGLPLWAAVLFPAVWIAVCDVLIARAAPFTHAFVNDWAAHLKWAGLFLTGVVWAGRPELWETARRVWPQTAGAALILLLAHLAAWFGLPPPETSGLPLLAAGKLLDGAYAWTAIVVLVGAAARFLDCPSPSLTYLNEAILPVYVLHQPALLLAAFFLFPLTLPLPLEAALLAAAAGPGALAAYHLLIRPFGPARFLFGLKRRAETFAPVRRSGRAPVPAA